MQYLDPDPATTTKSYYLRYHTENTSDTGIGLVFLGFFIITKRKCCAQPIYGPHLICLLAEESFPERGLDHEQSVEQLKLPLSSPVPDKHCSHTSSSRYNIFYSVLNYLILRVKFLFLFPIHKIVKFELRPLKKLLKRCESKSV